jgi:Right handed beta helix region
MRSTKHLIAIFPLTILLFGSIAMAKRGMIPLIRSVPSAAHVNQDNGRVILQVKNKKGCAAIQNEINDLPPQGGRVLIGAGTFTCSDPLVIDRDNVELRGAGPATILRLADGANAPVVIIGQTVPVPTVTRRNITVSDLVIDGNRANQTFECFKGDCSTSNPLRNNAITLRRVTDARIERIAVFGARSGGLVSELTCRRLTIIDFTSSDNHFDGVAGYETENSVFSRVYLHHNMAAGFSFDIAFNNNVISDTVIADNAKVGIFMRDSNDNVFHGLQIRNSGEHGVFLAQVDTDATKPAAGNTFIALTVSHSQGAGIRINDLSCVNNAVVGSQFVGNSGGCISEASPGLALASANICR